jgi:predicted metal-dependent hydrolase
MAEAVVFGDPAIEVRLRRHARARRLVLRVARDGLAPTLTLPPGVPLATATAFLARNESWLRSRLAAGPVRIAVGDGVLVPFRGGHLVLRSGGGRGIARVGDTLLLPGPADQVGPRALAWLRETARAALLDRCTHHARALGRGFGRLSLRDPRSRWGSCTSAGDLMFSWRLVMAPEQVLDYVAAHEVAHLAEMNHSVRFWAVARGLCPEMQAPRDWLRRNGAVLHGYDFTAPLDPVRHPCA